MQGLRSMPRVYGVLPAWTGAVPVERYGDKDTEHWFVERYRASGKKLDMGKSCVRFKRLEDLPLDLIGEAIARTPPSEFIERYEASRRDLKRAKR